MTLHASPTLGQVAHGLLMWGLLILVVWVVLAIAWGLIVGEKRRR